MVSILCCQSLSVIDSCSVCLFSWFILCHFCGLNFACCQSLCHWLLFYQSFFFWFIFLCHSCGLNLVLSITLCHWFLFCQSIFLTFSVSLVVSILCCQSLSVINFCFVCPFSSLILCHLCGLNLVVSVTLCHWLLFCQSFFLTHSLSLLWSQSCVVDHVLSLILVLWVLLFSFFLCHSCGLNHVLSVTLCHWLLFCQSIFLILSLSPLCCRSLSVIDSCFVCPFSSLILCHLCGLNLVLSVTLCHWLLFCQLFFLTHSLSP